MVVENRVGNNARVPNVLPISASVAVSVAANVAVSVAVSVAASVAANGEDAQESIKCYLSFYKPQKNIQNNYNSSVFILKIFY